MALQGLCCLDVQGDDVLDLMMDFIGDCNAPLNTVVSARELLAGALGDTDRCNEYLKRHCRHWGLARLALVDRGILRLGVHELLSGQAPPKVIIAESLKLAREFSTAESPRFINGVLDSVVKELANGVATGNGQLATGDDNDSGNDSGDDSGDDSGNDNDNDRGNDNDNGNGKGDDSGNGGGARIGDGGGTRIGDVASDDKGDGDGAGS